MRKNISIIVILSIGLIILAGLIRQISSALQATNRLDDAATEVTMLQEENRELKKQLEKTETIAFIEEMARNKLNLNRSNETIFIIPQDKIKKVIEAGKPVEIPKTPNYQGWLELFLN